jgi:hypothetical protein
VVTVEREVSSGNWKTFADQSGEIPVTLEFPQGEEVASYLSGDQAWPWTAHFEAFVAPFDTGSGSLATPAGNYRFVVHGMHRSGGSAQPYDLTSETFEVKPWSGITVNDLRLEDDRTVSFKVGPRSTRTVTGGGPEITAEIGPIDYPDSYDSPTRFIRDEKTAYRDPAAPGDASKLEWFCFTCSFRPWIDTGDAAKAFVTIRNGSGKVMDRVPATPDGDRWVTSARLPAGHTATVEAGDVTDAYGDYNGAASGPLDGGPAPQAPADEPPAGEQLADAPAADGTGDEVAPPVASATCTNPIRGTAKREVLRGTAAGDRINGGGGDDRLSGLAGDDCLTGGGGRDVIRCGKGDDVARVTRRDEVHGCERVYLSSR